MADIHIGDAHKVWVTWQGPDGQDGDPDTVTLTIRKPDGTVLEVEQVDIIHADEDSGYYEAVFVVDQDGRWDGEWFAEGGVLTSERQPVAPFRVMRRRVGEPTP